MEELFQDSVIRNYRITPDDGKNYKTFAIANTVYSQLNWSKKELEDDHETTV